MEFACTLGKSKLILLTAIEVDCLSFKRDAISLCQIQRIICVPMGDVNGITECVAQNTGQRPSIAQVGVHLLRRFGNQGRTLCAH